jgi:hypothetical protein
MYNVVCTCSEETNILYWADYAAKVKQKSIVQYLHDEPNEPTKKGPFRMYSKTPLVFSVLTVSSGLLATPLRSLCSAL